MGRKLGDCGKAIVQYKLLVNMMVNLEYHGCKLSINLRTVCKHNYNFDLCIKSVNCFA